MDDRSRKLEHILRAILVSALMWIGAMVGFHAYYEYRGCVADRALAR